MAKALGIFLVIVTAFVGESALANQSSFPRIQLEEMFANIRAKTTWDIEGNMLWGYFFRSLNKGELEKIGVELVSNGYRLVKIRQVEVEAPHVVSEWQLHVERVEPHTLTHLMPGTFSLRT